MTSTDYAGLGPFAQDPSWVKTNSVPLQKKTKKRPDAKPQSHINKCLNEKRRREQENTYFEELAELIQASFVDDMNSLSAKPDKCVILKQTVDKINRIKEAESSGEAVQQGEVTSSQKSIFQNKLDFQLVLQALDGFLFLVRADRKIELVSDNVQKFTKYTPEDLVGNDIFNFVHPGDINKFSPWLSTGGTPSQIKDVSRSISFPCRFIVKLPDDQGENMEEKQQRVQSYEPMQICAVLQSNYPGDRAETEADSESERNYLLCIARRNPLNEPRNLPVEQFTTRLDLSGHILQIDSSGLSLQYSKFLTKDLIKHHFRDICHPSDLSTFSTGFQEALHKENVRTGPYKIKVGVNSIRIKTMFKQYHDGFSEPFINATHTFESDQEESGTSSTAILSSETILEESIGTPTSRAIDEESPDSKNNILTESNEGKKEASKNSEGFENQQQNKILKRLLNQNDEDEGVSCPVSLFSRVSALSHLQEGSQPVNHHSNHCSEANANSRIPSATNNMLRNLLNDSEDEESKMKRDEFLLNASIFLTDSKEEKFPIKQEFCSSNDFALNSNLSYLGMSPSTPPATLAPSGASSFSIPNSSPMSFGNTSRPASVDLMPETDLVLSRGIKRPSDTILDGNPSNKVNIGGFESLLIPSPPTGIKSPVSKPLGTGNTPIASPTAPSSRSNTPIGRATTPVNRSNTPIGRSNTPIAKSTVGLTSHVTTAAHIRVATPYSSVSISSAGNPVEDSQHQVMVRQQPNQHANMVSNVGISNSFQDKSAITGDLAGDEASKSNKLLRELLSNQPTQVAPPLDIMPSPYALPSEKLPKDIVNKVPRHGCSNSSSIPYSTAEQPTTILNSILSRPSTANMKANITGNSFHQRPSQQMPNYYMGDNKMGQHLRPQNLRHPTMQHQSVSNDGIINTHTSTVNEDSRLTSILSSADQALSRTMPSATTTTLPPFVPPSGINPLGAMSSGNFTDGHLPSIQTATSVFTQEPQGAGDLHDMVIQTILDMESSATNIDYNIDPLLGEYNTYSNYDKDEKHAIQQIQDKLMSELENQTTSAPSMIMTTYLGSSQSMPSMNNYPPAYAQRGRFQNQMPIGRNNMIIGVGGNMPIRNVQSVHQQRMSQMAMQQQDHMKPRMQRHQAQVLMPSSSSEVAQTSSSGYNPNLEELINSPASNVNVLHRSTSEPQNSPNYGLMNSPMGSTTDQLSPGQRIAQPSFSPRTQIPSPLSNTQQYNINSGMGQINYQNSQPNPQLSPRLSQGSPAPSGFSGGATGLPQVSPTGQPTSVQQGPGWSGGNPQQRSNMQQGSMMGSQINQVMNVRGYGTANRPASMIATSVPLSNTVSRQSPYPPMGHGNVSNDGFNQSHQLAMYSQQQQQQQAGQSYRIQRSVSTPVQMQSVHSARSAHYPLHHPGSNHLHPHHHSPNNAPTQQQLIGGQYSHHHAQSPIMPHTLMGGQPGHIDAGPQMMANSMMAGVVGGVMGAQPFGDGYEASQTNSYANSDNSRSSPAGHSGMVSNRTRNQLLARVGQGAVGANECAPSSPSVSQIVARVPTQQPNSNRQQSAPQNSAGYQTGMEHQAMIQPMSSTNGNNWGREVQSATNPSAAAGLPTTARIDETRNLDGVGSNDPQSMLKKLLEE